MREAHAHVDRETGRCTDTLSLVIRDAQRACLCTVYTATESLVDQGDSTLVCRNLLLRSMSVNQIHLNY